MWAGNFEGSLVGLYLEEWLSFGNQIAYRDLDRVHFDDFNIFLKLLKLDFDGHGVQFPVGCRKSGHIVRFRAAWCLESGSKRIQLVSIDAQRFVGFSNACHRNGSLKCQPVKHSGATMSGIDFEMAAQSRA